MLINGLFVSGLDSDVEGVEVDIGVVTPGIFVVLAVGVVVVLVDGNVLLVVGVLVVGRILEVFVGLLIEL